MYPYESILILSYTGVYYSKWSLSGNGLKVDSAVQSIGMLEMLRAEAGLAGRHSYRATADPGTCFVSDAQHARVCPFLGLPLVVIGSRKLQFLVLKRSQ